MTTEQALRSELQDIQRRRPDIVRAPDVRGPSDVDVKAFVTVMAQNATVETDATSSPVCPLTLRLLEGDGSPQVLMLDLPSALALFHALDNSIDACSVCEQPDIADRLARCAETDAPVHDECHRCRSVECSERSI